MLPPPTPPPPPRTSSGRRRRPASTARQVVGVASVAGVVGLTGWFALNGLDDTDQGPRIDGAQTQPAGQSGQWPQGQPVPPSGDDDDDGWGDQQQPVQVPWPGSPGQRSDTSSHGS